LGPKGNCSSSGASRIALLYLGWFGGEIVGRRGILDVLVDETLAEFKAAGQWYGYGTV
jgi:hypothetical protein